MQGIGEKTTDRKAAGSSQTERDMSAGASEALWLPPRLSGDGLNYANEGIDVFNRHTNKTKEKRPAQAISCSRTGLKITLRILKEASLGILTALVSRNLNITKHKNHCKSNNG